MHTAAAEVEMTNEPSSGPCLVLETARFDERSAALIVVGDLDLATHDQLGSAIATEIAAGRNRLVIDLSDTAFVDSSAMGVLLRGVAVLADDATAGIALVTSPGITRRALEVSGVLGLFSSFETRAEAVAGLAGDAPLSDAWRGLRRGSRCELDRARRPSVNGHQAAAAPLPGSQAQAPIA